EPPPYVPEEHLLRPRLGGAVVLLVVGLVGAAAYGGGDAIMLFWVLYALLPTVVAALLSLASWANRRHPQQVLLTILILALAVGPAIAVQRFAQSSGNALLLLVGAVVFVISVWLPQATVALLYFQLRRPGGIILSPRFSLRTFMILVTVVAIVLAGARYYEQSSLEVAL